MTRKEETGNSACLLQEVDEFNTCLSGDANLAGANLSGATTASAFTPL